MLPSEAGLELVAEESIRQQKWKEKKKPGVAWEFLP
jgi:hypothetical protein